MFDASKAILLWQNKDDSQEAKIQTARENQPNEDVSPQEKAPQLPPKRHNQGLEQQECPSSRNAFRAGHQERQDPAVSGLNTC